MSDPTRVPSTKCIECGQTLNAVGSPDDSDARPQSGDPIACLGCGAVMTISHDGALRGFTDVEMDKLISDTEMMDQLSILVERIHLLKKVN